MHTGASGPIRVLSVDDHPLFRDGLAALLATHADLVLAGEAGNGIEAIERYRALRPGVVLMDLSMPVMGGVEATGQILALDPHARIIALTTYAGDADIHRALEAGACGYLLKDTLRGTVVDAIRTVARGGRVIPPDVAGTLAAHTPRNDLTPRELEVLTLLARGLQNSAIAEALVRTEATVKVHIHHILAKLGAKDRTDAVVIALRRGIIHLD